MFLYWFSVWIIYPLLKGGYWSSWYYRVAVCFSLGSVNISFICFDALMLTAYIFTAVVSSSSIDLFVITNHFGPSAVFGLKSLLSDVSTATPAFILVSICSEYLFIPSLSLCVCPSSCSEPLVASTDLGLFKNPKVPLCLWMGEFSPFIFKVIMGRCGVTILLIVFWLFCSRLKVTINQVFHHQKRIYLGKKEVSNQWPKHPIK